MPCYEPRLSPDAVREDCAREFRHNSDVAQMLCEACELLQRLGWMNEHPSVSDALKRWWDEHKTRDSQKKR